MRGPIATVLAGCLSCGSLAAPTLVRAESATEPSPAQLYDEGRKAYRLGNFEAAVEKWQRAYELSDRALLLYNIALAYQGLYGISRDVADLRRARAVLDNFIKLAEADPELELDDAPERLAELDALIAKAEAEDQDAGDPAAASPPPQAAVPPADATARPVGDDPGKVFRWAGIGLMASGGVLLLTGAGLGGYYIVTSRDYADRLQAATTAYGERRCRPSSGDSECLQLEVNIETYRSNGRQANRDGAIAVGVTGGLAVATTVIGAVLYVQGKRRTRAWERGAAASVRLHWTGTGFALSGRF